MKHMLGSFRVCLFFAIVVGGSFFPQVYAAGLDGRHTVLVGAADAASRAEARSVASEMATGFFALRGQCPFNLHRKPSPLPADAGRAADVARINAIWSSLLEKSGGPFLFGGFAAAF